MARTKHITAAATQEVQTENKTKVVSYTTVGTVFFDRVLNKETNKMELKALYLHMLDGHTYKIDMTKAKDAKTFRARDLALKSAMIELGRKALCDQAVIQEITETVE